MTVTMTPAEQAAFEAYQAANNKTVATKIVVAASKKSAKAPSNQALALPDGIEETADEYIIHVPKNGRWHVSASGKSEVQNIDRLLPKGTHGLGLFGKLFRPA
jgi:streptogramin lyase